MVSPKYETRGTFTVAGLKYRGGNENDEVSQLWDSYGERMDEIHALAITDEAFGVCYEHDHDNGTFSYIAGVAVGSDREIPAEMDTVSVPEQTYAVFTATLDSLGETIDTIYDQWFPASEYRRADGPEFERYGREFDSDSPDSEFEYFVPVASGT
ncbi:GyrI-like domain-containing protein [Haladaptatus sp. DFWS20]|uniref:GyrI-like domain-containing protein n=1 Tax=Haladaptatus sp. DFWS20 TaxID=3403467 RepID=UPI003EBC586C